MELERTADQVDIAQAMQDDLNNRSLAAARQKSLPENPEGFDGKNCFECGDSIHPARLELGRCLCLDCQVLRENLLKRNGK